MHADSFLVLLWAHPCALVSAILAIACRPVLFAFRERNVGDLTNKPRGLSLATVQTLFFGKFSLVQPLKTFFCGQPTPRKKRLYEP